MTSEPPCSDSCVLEPWQSSSLPPPILWRCEVSWDDNGDLSSQLLNGSKAPTHTPPPHSTFSAPTPPTTLTTHPPTCPKLMEPTAHPKSQDSGAGATGTSHNRRHQSHVPICRSPRTWNPASPPTSSVQESEWWDNLSLQTWGWEEDKDGSQEQRLGVLDGKEPLTSYTHTHADKHMHTHSCRHTHWHT